ncbi:hypothetical protein BDZ89DRAFT_26303 [Hymenopellis radicata]|nr:hypothetical protein BDZ89DRAFT_26303 [Hymenopellis radicata]
MDKTICKLMEKDDLSEADVDAPDLLEVIIHVYSICGKNKEAYCVTHKPDVAQLIAQNASLRPALEKAWKEKSFAQITSSVLFCKGPGERPSFEVQMQIDATEKAWKYSYIGPYADVLKDTIVKEKATPNFLDVIQSSGFGKSRTVYEVGRKLFSVYINLRDEKGTGYPSRDPALCKFISRAEYYRDDLDRKSHCAAFLRGIFTAAISALGTEQRYARGV